MKKYFFFLLFTFFLLGSLSAKKPVIHSFYQHTVFKIDGEVDDWGDMAIYDEKTTIVSNISNDQEYIYVKLRIASPRIVSRLLLSGLVVWFNDDGKPRPKKGVAFPIAEAVSSDYRKLSKMLRGLSRDQMDRAKKLFLEEFNTKFATGLATINVLDKNRDVILSKSICKNEKGLSTSLKLKDFDLLFYEARIPLDMVFDNKEDFLKSKKESFSLGFEFGRYEIEELKNQANNVPNDSRRSPYAYSNKHRMEDYGIIPAVNSWFKRVYLSNK